MPHVATAHSIKQTGAGAPHQDAPRPGTRIRRVYDLLFANAGRWVPMPGMNNGPNVAEYLRSSYGLDVRCRHVGIPGIYRGGTTSEWLLAGEWVGRVYLDYVVDPSLATKEK